MDNRKDSQTHSSAVNPKKLFELAFGFMASKTILAAVKLGVFTLIGDKKISAEEIREGLKLHPLCIFDFLDSLHALGLLNRDGFGEDALYSNTAETGLFLDKTKPTYVGGLFEMSNDRLYPFWSNLEEALRTAKPQNESKNRQEEDLFEVLYEDPNRLTQFMEAMSSIQFLPFKIFSSKFDFKPYKTICDVGGASGIFSVQIALQNPHMQCISFDLPKVGKIATECVQKFKVEDRVKVVTGSFFDDALPKADVIAMGNILHDWNEEKKMKLIKAAYEALPENGAFVAIEAFIDDERKTNVSGLLMSLNMRIETGDAYNFSYAEFQEMCKKVGFGKFDYLFLTEGGQAAIAYKVSK